MPLPLQIFIGLEIAAVIVAAFLYVPPARGFADKESARIIIFHVPCAMIATLAYAISTIYAIAYLIRGNTASDMKSAASASLGFLFTALATVTGMIFAKMEWGMAWNWDPREVSILMLMIVYAAYFALRGSILNSAARAKISSVYNIMAGLLMPFFIFVLPRLVPGLHPSNTLTSRSGLSPEYRIALGGAMLGYMMLYIWILRLSVRISEHAMLRRRKSIER